MLEVKNGNGTAENLIWTTFPGLRAMADSSKVFPFVRVSTPKFSVQQNLRSFRRSQSASLFIFLYQFSVSRTRHQLWCNEGFSRNWYHIPPKERICIGSSHSPPIWIQIKGKVKINVKIFPNHFINAVWVSVFIFLQRFANLDMESMVYTGYVAGNYGNSYEFIGDLGLVQKQPLWSRHHDNRFNFDVVPRDSVTAKHYDLSNIIREYAERNGRIITIRQIISNLISPHVLRRFACFCSEYNPEE